MNKFVERFGWYGSDWFLENDEGDVAWVAPMVKEHIERLETENAKLRNLVAQMYPRAKAFLQMGVQLGCNDTLSYDWELQMQALGIEVDE